MRFGNRREQMPCQYAVNRLSEKFYVVVAYRLTAQKKFFFSSAIALISENATMNDGG